MTLPRWWACTAVGIFYGMLGPELRSTRHQDGIVAAGSRLGWAGRLTDQQNALMELTHSEAFRGRSARNEIAERKFHFL